MSHQSRTNILSGVTAGAAGVIAGVAILFFSSSVFAEDAVAVKVDAVAAKRLARTDHCLRCHSVDRKKEGPSYQSVAYKYMGQADAADKLLKHITAGEDRVKLSDGHIETHKFDKTTDVEQMRNLVNWILAQ